MKHFVYKTININTGEFYIGAHSCSGKNVDCLNGVCNYLGSGTILKRALKKYGRSIFTREVLAEASSIEEVFNLEAVHLTPEIVSDPKCYNLISGGYGGPNYPKSEEFKKHLSEVNKGVPKPPRSIEHTRKISEVNKGRTPWNKGISPSMETRALWSKQRKGRKPTAESRIKQSKAQMGRVSGMKGKKHSPETRAQMSESLRRSYAEGRRTKATALTVETQPNYFDTKPQPKE